MKIHEITIKKDKFLQLQEAEQKLIVQFGHVFNELTCLRKLLESVIDLQTSSVERQAMLLQSLIVSRIFFGKLFEAWEMITKNYFPQRELSTAIDLKLSSEGKKSLAFLKKYFGKNNLLCHVRNKFAFHYSSEHLSKPHEFIAEDGFLLYLCEKNDNSFYFSSEAIVTAAILEYTKEVEPQAAMDKYFEELRCVGDHMISFFSESLEIFLSDKIKPLLEDEDHTVHAVNPTNKLGDLSLPFFFK